MDTSGSRGPFLRAVKKTTVNNEDAEYLKIHPHTYKVSSSASMVIGGRKCSLPFFFFLTSTFLFVFFSFMPLCCSCEYFVMRSIVRREHHHELEHLHKLAVFEGEQGEESEFSLGLFDGDVGTGTKPWKFKFM